MNEVPENEEKSESQEQGNSVDETTEGNWVEGEKLSTDELEEPGEVPREETLELAGVQTKRWTAKFQVEGKPARDLVLYGKTEEEVVELLNRQFPGVCWAADIEEAGYVEIGGRIIVPASEVYEIIDRQYDFAAKKKKEN